MSFPLKTNMTGWKIPMCNRKYIDSFMEDLPTSYSFVLTPWKTTDRKPLGADHSVDDPQVPRLQQQQENGMSQLGTGGP